MITRDRFHELLLAYMGAVNHLDWAVKEHGSQSQQARLASEAAIKALQDFEREACE